MKRKKKSRKRTFVFFILIILAVIFTYKFLTNLSVIDFEASDYKIIKEDKNQNYLGVGQENARHKDGYFTTFTTVSDNKKTYREYKQNGKSSWSENDYWDGTMSDNGCGITSLAIILSGYGKDITPEDLRKKYYPVLDNEKISQELRSSFGLKNSDFYYDKTHLSQSALTEHLLTNRPVLICVWDKPSNNRWTTASHYMVLLAADGEGKVYVSNPNGAKFAYNSSGWYDFDEVEPYIAKALYIESYK